MAEIALLKYLEFSIVYAEAGVMPKLSCVQSVYFCQEVYLSFLYN